jgi:hypothetical protein
MKILLTLCDKNNKKDIPVHEFNIPIAESDFANEAQQLFYHWVEMKNLEKSVLVCFENFRGLPIDELRDEQRSFLISHNWDDITDFCETALSSNYGIDHDLNFAVFEFEDYKDALGYCLDLKEGF